MREGEGEILWMRNRRADERERERDSEGEI